MAISDVLHALTGEQPIPLDDVNLEGLPADAELYAMVKDERYEKDEAFRNKTDALFKKRWPGGVPQQEMSMGE